jgi:hypothetical protein
MKEELIVHVGAEGGSLTLYGVRQGQGWLYSRNLFDQTLSWVDEDAPVIDRDSKVVDTWPKALKLLDEYTWHQLYPLEVHPKFQEKVYGAVLVRTMQDGISYHIQKWEDICGMPNCKRKGNDFSVGTIIQEIMLPKFRTMSGILFAATPLCTKPEGVGNKAWALAIMKDVRRHEYLRVHHKCVFAVPTSFWSASRGELVESAALADVELVGLMDEWDGYHDFGDMTPMDSIRQIIDHLQRGENVIILSHRKKMSDFVRIIISLVSQEHNEHPEKFWREIANDDSLELTQFQRGYIYGLTNATAPFDLEKLGNKYYEGGCL